MLAIGMVAALAACANQPGETATPEPTRSISAEDRAVGEAALDAFLTAMREPDITYRVTGHLQVPPFDDNGQAAIDIRTWYDVMGDGYAGSSYLAGWDRNPAIGGNVSLVVVGETAQVISMAANEPNELPAPASLHRPSALQGLTADELSFVGIGDGGLFEYAVSSWLGGDPIGEWADLRVVPPEEFPPTELRSHDTRLFLDESGVPRRMVRTWTFAAVGTSAEATGAIVEEIDGLGMYVAIVEQDGLLHVTSHDVVVGVDANRQIITEPWSEVVPEGQTADLDVEFVQPAQPVMLGIEGAIGFIRSHDSEGAMILDRTVDMVESTTLEIAAGEQTMVVYFRTCNGNCAILDEPNDFCRIDADIKPNRSYRTVVRIVDRESATCTLEEAR
jgi:hypothetical protein